MTPHEPGQLLKTHSRILTLETEAVATDTKKKKKRMLFGISWIFNHLLDHSWLCHGERQLCTVIQQMFCPRQSQLIVCRVDTVQL